jgi:hypothetical protein
MWWPQHHATKVKCHDFERKIAKNNWEKLLAISTGIKQVLHKNNKVSGFQENRQYFCRKVAELPEYSDHDITLHTYDNHT